MIVAKSHLRLAAVAWAIGSLASTPAVAQQPNGYPITNVNLRAGPGTEYPVIVTVPGRAPISILGCLPDYSWCDSLFQGNRGWMRSIYLSGYYQGNYYSLGDYAPRLGYRTVSFDIDGYWASNYRDRPFYGERTRWKRPREEGFVNTGIFYKRLAPYGSWVWIQGQYVWVPSRVDRSWRPYTRGRWVYTDRGWTWVSNEPFGWATYHYGRWGFSNRVGWFWVPGSRWAPAWVSWRESDDYLAWAPMPPAYDGGINVNVSIGTVPDYYWQVVPSRSFLSDDLQGQIVRDRNRQRPILERSRALGNTTITNNNVVVNNVVNVTYVEEKTQEKVVERKITRAKDAKAAGKVEGDAVEIFQPSAESTPADLAPPEPKTIGEVATQSATKEQAEGQATTEEMLVPPEIQKAQEKRKAAKPAKGEMPEGGEPTAPAAGGEAPLSPSLPKGGEASAPPPEGAAPAGKPVPAEDLTPAAAEPAPPAPSSESLPPPPPPEAEAPRPADRVPAGPPTDQTPPPAVTPEPPIEDQAPAKAKEKGINPKKGSEAQPGGPPPMKPLPQEEAPPPPAPQEMSPPPQDEAPPPPAPQEMAPPPPTEEFKPKPKEGKARTDKSTKAKEKGAEPAGESPTEQTAPPPPVEEAPPPPLPPMEELAPQPKKEGKGRNDNGGPPPPDSESGHKAKPGKKNKGAPPCPEGTVPLEEGSCAPL
jgi:uncharacterized protein YraI